MPPRLFSVLSILNDIKDAFLTLLEKPNRQPALLVIYAFIDICAALSNRQPEASNGDIFRSYLDEFMSPGTKRAIPPAQLWAARSALLHSFSPLGRQTKAQKLRPIFYFAWDEREQDVRARLRARGYTEFTLLALTDIKAIAIWTFNGMLLRAETDAEFREIVLSNAEHLLLDFRTTQIEEFFSFVDQLGSEGHPPDRG